MTKIETSRTRIIARLTRDGWELVRHGKEHDVYRRLGKSGQIAVPRHRDLSPGVARSIAKQAGWLEG